MENQEESTERRTLTVDLIGKSRRIDQEEGPHGRFE